MSGDFAERLAAVDDAIAGAAEDGTGNGYGVEAGDRRRGVEGDGERTAGEAPDAGAADAGGVREREAGTAVSDSRAEESVVGDSRAEESVVSDSRAEESVIGDSVAGGSGAVDVVALEDRVAELEAAVQALRGYAGSVRAVNDRVEERADAAVATAEDCRERVGALERRVGGADDRFADSRAAGGERADGARRGAGERRGPGERGGRRSSDGSVSPRAVRDNEATRRVDGSRDFSGGESVPWPPTDPRAPYGDVDADDDREQSGLLARLRDAL